MSSVPQLDRAARWLRTVLASNGLQRAEDLRVWASAVGHSPTALARASKTLHLQSEMVLDVEFWSLPEPAEPDPNEQVRYFHGCPPQGWVSQMSREVPREQ